MRWMMPLALVMAAAVALVTLIPENERSMVLDAPDDAANTLAWSEQVNLTFAGTGSVTGTSKDLVVNWQAGTLRAEVAPNTGTGLSVRTDEGSIDVVGTVFSVRRDALGVTTWVDKGRVAVSCEDGWQGEITPQMGSHTCLPVRPAMLLGRADALVEQAAPASDVLDALNRGMAAAQPGAPVVGELLALRMEVLSDAGRPDEALRDADAYLASEGPRSLEVRRFAAWLALAERGCASAMPYLERLGPSGMGADQVLLAECLITSEPSRARALLGTALALPDLDEEWTQRALQARRILDGVTP
ncbi:MAG: FecR family protein [Myxococcales bacterium]|nr:FecR family protein [Myxococcales bacterium]